MAGTIGAEEVIVSSTGAAYFFDPGYKLKPLSEASEYIKENHHLPQNSIRYGSSGKGRRPKRDAGQAAGKIEELTLYLMEKDEKNRKLQERIDKVEQLQTEGRAK